MARASREAKAASKAAIISQAGHLFRENGIEATSIADVMAAAGLTHGGFYRHFNSKDELVAAAVTDAVENVAAALDHDIAARGPTKALADYVKRYLSEEHCLNAAEGCPLAALLEEAGRGQNDVRQAISESATRIIDVLARAFPGSQESARQKATYLVSMLVGSMALARAETVQSRREEILSAARGFALSQIQE